MVSKLVSIVVVYALGFESIDVTIDISFECNDCVAFCKKMYVRSFSKLIIDIAMQCLLASVLLLAALTDLKGSITTNLAQTGGPLNLSSRCPFHNCLLGCSYLSSISISTSKTERERMH